jgi:hypothetical protein
MRRRLRTLAVALVLTAQAALAQAQGAVVLKIDAATQRRLGVVTAPLTAARRSGVVTGFARALDPVPLATLDSDIATAASAAAASQAEATRTRALNAADQTVSKQVAEAAQATARADAAKLQLLRRRVGLEWGPALANDARRSRLVADIAAGRAALIRVDSAQGLANLKGSVAIDLGSVGTAYAVILGPTRVGDPRLQSTGVLALVSGAQAVHFGVGTTAPASIALGAGVEGVVLPRAALLRTAGQTFVYIRKDAGSFERRPVTGGIPDPQGLFAPRGFRPGETVAVAGASQLFAAEKPSVEG